MQSDICDTVEDLAKQVIDTDETRKDGTLRLGTFAQFKLSHSQEIQHQNAAIMRAHRKIPHFSNELSQVSLVRHYN